MVTLGKGVSFCVAGVGVEVDVVLFFRHCQPSQRAVMQLLRAQMVTLGRGKTIRGLGGMFEVANGLQALRTPGPVAQLPHGLVTLRKMKRAPGFAWRVRLTRALFSRRCQPSVPWRSCLVPPGLVTLGRNETMGRITQAGTHSARLTAVGA